MAMPAADRLAAGDIRRRTGLARVRVYARLRSTQAAAAGLVDAGGLGLPGAVVASRQTAGRGRGENRWWSDAGSLTVTFALPIRPGRAAQELPLRAGLAVCDTVGRYVEPGRVKVKWPNDVLVDGKKIAGVLCERRRGADLVGIGLNVGTDFSRAPAEVKRRATSIRRAGGRARGRAEVLAHLAAAILAVWEDEGWHERLLRVHALTGFPVAVDTAEGVVRGLCEGIDSEGRLLVREGGKLRRLLGGTIMS